MNARIAQLPRRADQVRSPEEAPIRLLIVDDSSVARAVLTRIVAKQTGLTIAGAAASAAEAVALLRTTTVDVVLLDIEMPGGSGLEALPRIVAAGRGARVLVVSTTADDGAEATVKALALGAADTMLKPSEGLFGGRFADALCEKLRRLGRVGTTDRTAPAPGGKLRLREVTDWEPTCIAIGGSTGGIHAINEFLKQLPARTGVPMLVTQHLPALFMPYFASQLATHCGRPVQVAGHDDAVADDHVYVAPGDAHLRLVQRGGKVKVRLDTRPAPSGCLPSVDPMLASVAEIYGRGGVAVMLSGMGRDGLIGSGALVGSGGVVVAQDRASSAIWGMPRAVAEAGLATAVMTPADLARRVGAQLGRKA